MIKNYSLFKESILNNLEGPSEEEVFNRLSKMNPTEMMFKSAEIGFLPGIKKAIELGAKFDDTISKEHYSGEWYTENILDVISKNGHFNIFDDVYKYFKRDNVKKDISLLNELLINSCESGNIKLAKKILEMGAKVYTRNNSPLIKASEYGHLELVKFLLDNGAYIHANHNDALKEAIKNNHNDVVEFLLEKGADLDDIELEKYDIDNVYEKNNIDLLKILFKFGFDINDFSDSNKYYMLLDLLRERRYEIIKLFVDFGMTLKKEKITMKNIDSINYSWKEKLDINIINLLKNKGLIIDD